MADARYVECEVLYDGKEIGLSARLKNLSYTDNSSGVSDEIVLTFSGRDADWLRIDFIPEKEHDLDVTLRLHNWKWDGDILYYHCGNFTLDDLTYSGSPRQCVIRGVSVPASKSFQVDPVSKTWQKVTLKQIAQELMEKYGINKLFYWGAEPVLEAVEQSSQTDSSFLYDVCEKQGMFLKVYKKALVIFDKAVYEPRGVTASFTEDNFDDSWSWNSTLNDTYTGATMSYTAPKPKRGKKGATQQYIEVSIGEASRLLHINEKADNEAEAQRIAKAKVNSENEKAVTMSFSAMGNPNVVATCNIEITGMGRCNGKYFVDK
ncbi:MAG: contractile injection system protein, VgrG/Pvc8 family, partial [Acetivibrio sp.]